jgi:hypothetical protein
LGRVGWVLSVDADGETVVALNTSSLSIYIYREEVMEALGFY